MDVGILSKFDDDKLKGDIDCVKSGEALQRDLDKLESWATTNHTRFNQSKSWILHLERNSSGYTQRHGRCNIGESSTALPGCLGQEGQLYAGVHQAWIASR